MTDNVDVQELEKFSQLAHKWWDKDSEFKPLHAINPARLAFVERLWRRHPRREHGGVRCERHRH